MQLHTDIGSLLCYGFMITGSFPSMHLALLVHYLLAHIRTAIEVIIKHFSSK